MRIFLVLLFCLCFIHQTFSQTQSKANDQKYAITMSAVIFPYKAGIQPGLQVRLGKRLALLSDLGFAVSDEGGRGYNETHFFKLASEIKYYSKRSERKYFSFQAGYIHRKFQAGDSGWFWRKDSFDATGYSSASISSPVLFTAIKLGTEIKLRKNFFLDFFMGMGVRYIHTSYETKDVHPIHLGGARDNIFELASYSWEHEGDQVKLHATAGVRVGIRF